MDKNMLQLIVIGALIVVDFLLLMFGVLPDFMTLPLQILMAFFVDSFLRHCQIETSP